jgi:hypothetical protein
MYLGGVGLVVGGESPLCCGGSTDRRNGSNEIKIKLKEKLGCFLRGFVSSKFDEMYENSLRLPDWAKFGPYFKVFSPYFGFVFLLTCCCVAVESAVGDDNSDDDNDDISGEQ